MASALGPVPRIADSHWPKIVPSALKSSLALIQFLPPMGGTGPYQQVLTEWSPNCTNSAPFTPETTPDLYFCNFRIFLYTGMSSNPASKFAGLVRGAPARVPLTDHD